MNSIVEHGFEINPYDPCIANKIVQGKQGADLHTSTFNQMVAYEVAREGFLDEHVRKIRRVYGERRDVMLSAMEEFFPDGVSWTRPLGGMFLWVTLPEGIDTTQHTQYYGFYHHDGPFRGAKYGHAKVG